MDDIPSFTYNDISFMDELDADFSDLVNVVIILGKDLEMQFSLFHSLHISFGKLQ